MLCWWLLLVFVSGGSGKVKVWPRMGRVYIYIQNFWLWSHLEAPKWVKDPENGQKLFRGSPAKVTDMYSLFKTWMVALCIDQDAIFFRGSDSCSSSGSNLNNT